MEIVIEIPDKYKELFEIERCKSKFDGLATNEFGYVLRKSFENATPLPKGHGRLIDVDAFIQKLKELEWISDAPFNEDCLSEDIFDEAPTLLEADKEK